MKGSVIAVHEQMEGKSKEKKEERSASKDCYCGEASKRFPHLTNGENRGVKPERPGKVGVVMHEYKEGKLHSGSPGPGKGPMVKSRDQAVAIAMSEAGMSRKKK